MAAVAAEAEARGVRSVAAVPIFIDGRHDTALVVYSGEPGRFDDEELRLLERLAGDVGFAIEAAGKEVARAQGGAPARDPQQEPRAPRARAHGRAGGRQRRAGGLQLLGVARPARAAARASTASARRCWRTTATSSTTRAADYLDRIRARHAAHGPAHRRPAHAVARDAQRDGVASRSTCRRWRATSPRDLRARRPAAAGRSSSSAEHDWSTGDPDLLRVVLDNLLGNAWKFTSRTAERAQSSVGVEQTRRRDAAFFVRDDGAGFDAHVRRQAVRAVPAAARRTTSSRAPASAWRPSQRIVRRHGGPTSGPTARSTRGRRSTSRSD